MDQGDTGKGQIRLPQPEEITQREKDDAMAAYLMMFASLAVGLPFPFVNLIASFVYYIVTRKTSPFVAFHGLQSLLFHVPVTLLNAGAIGWSVAALFTGPHFPPVFFAYLLFTAAVNVLYIVFSIIALIAAHKGRFYYMPLFGRVAFARWYGRRETARRQAPAWENKPPEGY
jgi:uncharacterized Tic20 family protein